MHDNLPRSGLYTCSLARIPFALGKNAGLHTLTTSDADGGGTTCTTWRRIGQGTIRMRHGKGNGCLLSSRPQKKRQKYFFYLCSLWREAAFGAWGVPRLENSVETGGIPWLVRLGGSIAFGRFSSIAGSGVQLFIIMVDSNFDDWMANFTAPMFGFVSEWRLTEFENRLFDHF
ncbi:hypothetical protein BD779DRAFT_1739541 [Infundibulicybe gibba]|nr:hypothetical protein BD779DRAFT_1739541 [Infundibulicybe gibba]